MRRNGTAQQELPLKIEAVDFFYLSMPEVTSEGDGSQDALLVRVAAGGYIGWGECEASPLVSIAAFVCPMSHGACRPVAASMLGQNVDRPEDIQRIAAQIELDSMDLLQARTRGLAWKSHCGICWANHVESLSGNFWDTGRRIPNFPMPRNCLVKLPKRRTVWRARPAPKTFEQ